MNDLLVFLPILITLLLAQGFFSGSEIALVSCDKLKLQSRAERGDKGAAIVLRLFQHPENTLATTLIGTNISTMTLTVLGTATMINLFGTGGELYSILMLTPLMLILGEIVPKSIYQQHADTIAPRIARLMWLLRTLLMPLTMAFGWVGNRIARSIGPTTTVLSPFVTRQRLRLMLETADQAAELAVLDRARIQKAVRLSYMSVGEAMVPLAKVVGAETSIRMKKLAALGRTVGHRRIPLFQGNISNIVAIASWTIWEELDPQFQRRKVSDFTVEPHFASSIQRLDELMPVLLSRSDHMAVVVDEFGTAAGIVTLEDLMLILLGDAARGVHLGPKGWEQPLKSVRLQEDRLLVDAKTRLVDAAEILDVEMPIREYHTVGGFLTSRLRRIPTVNDSVEEFGYRFTVMEASSRAPSVVLIEPIIGG